MIGIDSNILLRWLVNDEPAQFALASKAFAIEKIHISLVTLIEALWVLRSRYGLSPNARHAIVRTLSDTSNVVMQHASAIRRALEDTALFKGDFPDHLIAVLNSDAGCDYTLTFDSKASRSPKFRKLTAKDS